MDIRNLFFKSHLEEGEQICKVVHKHWFVIVSGMFFRLFAFFAAPIVLYIIFPLPFFFLLMIVWLFVGVLKVIYFMFDWYLDAWLLTNQAIISVQWDGFFKRSAQRIEYQSIEQLAYAFNGIGQTLFRYGTLTIQQAGGDTHIENIEHPKLVASEIARLQEEFISGQKYEDEEALKDILTGMIKRHIKTNGVKVDIKEE